MERLVSENDKKEFVENALSYISKKGWTISNVNDVFFEVTDHMEKNAVLQEVSDQIGEMKVNFKVNFEELEKHLKSGGF